MGVLDGGEDTTGAGVTTGAGLGAGLGEGAGMGVGMGARSGAAAMLLSGADGEGTFLYGFCATPTIGGGTSVSLILTVNALRFSSAESVVDGAEMALL